MTTCETTAETPPPNVFPILAEMPFKFESRTQPAGQLWVTGFPEGHGGGVEDVVQLVEERGKGSGLKEILLLYVVKTILESDIVCVNHAAPLIFLYTWDYLVLVLVHTVRYTDTVCFVVLRNNKHDQARSLGGRAPEGGFHLFDFHWDYTLN